MTEVRIQTEGYANVRAELVAPEEVDDQLAFAAMAVDALFAAGEGLFEPLAVDVELACCDGETGYPLDEPTVAVPFHQLRLASVPETVAVREVWNGTRVERRERLGRAEILDWLHTIVAAQHCPRPDTTTGWTQLLVGAVRAHLPAGLADADELPVSYGAGMIRYPVERSADGCWVAGPLATNYAAAPFEARIVNEGGVLSFELTLNWSPWIDPDGTGRPDVDAVVDRLTDLGWDTAPVDPS